jgi:iron complex outermembrane receptor protein
MPVMVPAAQVSDDFMGMSLEALMDVEITSVSKKKTKKSEAAAAVFVITNEDLRRWGVTNIPDALRRVPGLQVAHIDANKWAITSRGFNSRFANKLLVLIDGRSVYTPLFAGVYWDANTVMLEDVERIEVIRGPGGTLWGANAVNGVINIITKSSADTQGTLVTAAAGNELEGMVNLRHGGVSKSGVNYRVYAMGNEKDTGEPIPFPGVSTAHDDADMAQAGFRTDWDKGKDLHTLQGDYYEGNSGQNVQIAVAGPPTVDTADNKGGNLLYRWTRTLSPDSSFTLQGYFDHVSRESLALYEDRQTIDLDFQHNIALNAKNDIIWGLNYRNIDDDTVPTPIFTLTPLSRSVDLFSGFIQDEISVSDRLKVTVGSKFEENDFTGFEFQPNIRAAWVTEVGNTVWGSISRAVRTPARGEHDVSLVLPAFGGATVLGSDAYESEDLIAYELGFRRAIAGSVTVDVAAYYNDYEDLRTVELAGPTGLFANNMEGTTQGIEIDVRWTARPWLAVNANYTFLDMDLKLINASADPFSQLAENASPEHTANLWVSADLGNNLEMDAGVRYVGSLTDTNPVSPTKIEDYVAFDARLGWTPKPGLDLSLIGQNLFDSTHREFNPDFIVSYPTEIERSIYGKVSWSFQ